MLWVIGFSILEVRGFRNSCQASEMFHLTAELPGWCHIFGARRSIFRLAVDHGARGEKGRCISHVPGVRGQRSIIVDLWFENETSLLKFIAAVEDQPGDRNIEIVARQAARPPTSEEFGLVSTLDSVRDDASPDQYSSCAPGSTAPGSTRADALRDELKLQRLDQFADNAYENMHIIPAAKLDDGRKLKNIWMFFSASPNFHKFFDGPDTAPHIQVTVVSANKSRRAGYQDVEVKVDTSRVGTKSGVQLPEEATSFTGGYQTTLCVPDAQSAHFQNAIKWRSECVSAAWERKTAGHPVGISGEHAWWNFVEFPTELSSAICEAKREAHLLPPEPDAPDAPVD